MRRANEYCLNQKEEILYKMARRIATRPVYQLRRIE